MASPYPLSSPYAGSTMQSSALGGSRGPPQPPRHRRAPSDGEALDVEALERENFDLKMRLYYLEEKGAADAGVPAQLYAALMRAGELQSALSRAEEEVEGKNTLLLKARGVIEALQAEAQSTKHSFAMERAALQAEANERAHAAAVSVESQAHAARAQAQEAQGRRMAAEEECAQLRLVLQTMETTTSHAAQEHATTLDHVRALSAQLESAAAATAAAEARHASLESQLGEWQREVSAREEAYKSAHAQLDALTREVDELRPAQARADAALERAHGLELALQAAQADLARAESEAEHRMQAAQAAMDVARSDDERRLRDSLAASHAAALAAQEDSARAAFAELQDAYTAQQLESKAAHESHLESLRQEYEAALQRESAANRERSQEAAQRFEHELATKGAAFDAAARELEQTMSEAHARAIDELERRHAEENRQAQAELDRARAELREEAASAQAAADAHRQAVALLEQQLSNTESSLRKDLEQAGRIHAMQLSRAEEKAAEALAAAQSDSSRGAEDLRAKETALLASVEAQWSERETALRGELGAALESAGKELDFVRTNVVRVLRNQLDQVESAMAREYVPLARVDEAAAREAAAKHELREVRARLGEKQSELEKLRSETVPLARFQEAEDALDKCQRELAAAQAQVARAQQSWAAHQRSSSQGAGSSPSPTHRNSHSLSPILHLSMYPSSSSSGTATAAGPASPRSHRPSSSSFGGFDSFLSSPTAAAVAAAAVPDLKPQLRKLQAENRGLQTQLSTLRARLAAEVAERDEAWVERSVASEAAEELHAAQARLNRRDSEVRQLRDLLVVARFPPSAQGAAQAAGLGGVDLIREMGAASGIEITSLSGASGSAAGNSSSPPHSPSHSRGRVRSGSHGGGGSGGSMDFASFDFGSASPEELAAEVSRLTRALKARSGELAASQVRLRATKEAMAALQDSTVDRAAAAELEAALDAGAKELAAREARLAAMASQLDQAGGALVDAEHAAEELRGALAAQRAESAAQLASLQNDAEEHVRQQRAHYESLLAERDASLAEQRAHDSQAQSAQAASLERALERAQRDRDAAAAEAARAGESLRGEVAQAQTRATRAEEDKARLEQIVGGIAQQLLELTAAAAFSAVEHPSPPAPAPVAGLAGFASSSSNLRSSPHAQSHSQARTPARVPASAARNTTRGALFSPGLSHSHSHAHTMSQSQLGGLFSPAAAAASPAHAAFPSLSMSPLQQQQQQQQQGGDRDATLSVAPQLATIRQCIAALAEHSAAFQDRLGEFEAAHAELAALRLQEQEHFAEAQSAAAKEAARLGEELRRAGEGASAAVQAAQHEAQLREQQLRHELDTLSRALHAAEENLGVKGRAIEQATRAVDEAQRDAQSLRQALAAATERADQAQAALRAAEEARARSEARLAATEAALAAAPTADAQQQLHERVHALQSEIARLEGDAAVAARRLSDAEADRAALASLRLAHSALQQAHDKVLAAAEIDADERRVVSLQLEQARAVEADHALLQQRLAQAERRTQIVGADQQLNVQVTRRVLVELCEVLHAAKIPASTYSDAGAARTPGFLLGGTFHYPDDAEQAIKWIRGKVHEMQRVRRAFEYTISEVEEKWKGNFLKLQSLLEQRGSEIAVLQRRLLTALGQKSTVTGTLKWH